MPPEPGQSGESLSPTSCNENETHMPSELSGSRSEACIERFLAIIDRGGARLPLSSVLISGNFDANWLSANRRVALWTWPDQLPPEGDLCHQIGGYGPRQGHFVVIDIDAFGRGFIEQDELGAAPLYFAHSTVVNKGDYTFIANRPALIADAWHRVIGQPLPRDPLFGALLAFKGHPMGDRCGYRGVRCVPFGARLRISPDHVQVERTQLPAPWRVADSHTTVEAAVDETEALLVEAFRAAVANRSSLAARPALELTGGRDSRLVLAIALRAGLKSDLDAITYGYGPQIEDRRIAPEVARAAGIRHVEIARDAASSVSGRSRRGNPDFLNHVRTSCGALNLSEAVRPPDQLGRAFVVSGLFGETLRTNVPSTSPYHTRALVLGDFYGRPNLDLLTERASFDVFVETMRLLLGPLAEGAAAEDLPDAFYLVHRVRRWISVRPETFGATFLALASHRAVQLAFALGWQGRVRNVIHDSIIARAGHGLGELPYAGSKNYREPICASSFRYPEQGPPPLGRDELLPAFRVWRQRRRWDFSATPHSATSLVTENRMRAYREIVHAVPENPAFEVIHRKRLLQAIRCLPALSAHHAKSVHGAMATVIWLGEMERDIRGSALGWLVRRTGRRMRRSWPSPMDWKPVQGFKSAE